MAKKTNKPQIQSASVQKIIDAGPQIFPTYVEPFLDEFIKEYGFYVVETRALPNIMDGQRIGARKILYSAFTGKLKKGREKMTALIGDTFSMEYHHGDASLQNTIEQLASKHFNQYCPLEVHGQIGSLRVPKVKTASRYLKTSQSDYAWMFKTDEKLWDLKVEDGKKVEPTFFLPIIPMVLLYRTNSPGFGFSFRSFSYKIEDIIDNCLMTLINGTCDDIDNRVLLRPEIYGIKDENIIFNNTLEQWYNVGEYMIEDDTLIVTDLPYNVNELAYEKKLIEYREKGEIKSWLNKGGKGKGAINYHITFFPNILQILYKEKWKFYMKFGLFKKITENTLNVLDINGKTIINYEDAYKLIDGFVRKRLFYYTKRKNFLINELNEEILKLTDLAKFLQLIITDQLVVNKRKIDEVKKDCDKFGVTYEGLKLAISKQTETEYLKFLEEIQDLKDQLELIKTTPEKEFYIQELIDMKEKIFEEEAYNQHEEIEYL